ncbi:MAG: ParB/RepB/Spo0J family partition protein [Ruminococcaceae bacterium]|nr:ParB/RepB/Spo0J family partition protein [Oscillospiraceae bacterium]
MAKKQALGLGIDAIFLDNSLDTQEKTHILRLSQIEPRQGQPRKVFDAEALSQLADSIAANGLIQPIIVRPRDNSDFYQIIAGERRWRAAKMAGLSEVPVVILDADDKKAAEYALIENIQREDLNPIEEAQGFYSLIHDYDLTQEQAAKQVGKSRAAVTNALRLLDLPEDVLALVSDKSLSAGHARTLLGISDKGTISDAAKLVIDRELSVRATEELVKKLNTEESPDEPEDENEAVERGYYTSLEEKITQAIGCKVKISHTKRKKTISISYRDADELEELIKKLVGQDNTENLFV